MNQSESAKRDLIALQARVHSQQQTIDVLERQLQIVHNQNEALMSRVLFANVPPQLPPNPQLGPAVGPPQPTARRTQIAFGPPPIEDGPGLPMPVPSAKGRGAPAPPTPSDLAETYVGVQGNQLFEDVGDEVANRLGLQHDDVTGTVQRGPRQPVQ